MKLKNLLLFAVLLFVGQTALAQTSATIKDVTTYSDAQNYDDEYGLYIEVAFDVSNMLNQQGKCAAYFYFADGQPLKDFNGVYNTADGNVSAAEVFTPAYTNATFSDVGVFIPYSELHLGTGSHNLKYFVAIFDHNNRQIASSQFINFTLTNN